MRLEVGDQLFVHGHEAKGDVELGAWGVRPSARDFARFLVDRTHPVRMVPTPSLALVYQGVGRMAEA